MFPPCRSRYPLGVTLGDDGTVSEAAESWASSPATRNVMRANVSRDTRPELRLRRALHALGLRYRVHWSLPFDRRRRADLAFTRAKVAVFVDGCFWHGCPEHYVPPSSNITYWRAKVEGNRARDLDTTSRLEELGWVVLRAWEHEPV
ncbi:MAG: DNA mismatch endonuclease Vsr, partial [Actinobacteria bacterium]|nr:DNA mismatch endonuclease Vsr [Actinomycetota bacterium]